MVVVAVIMSCSCGWLWQLVFISRSFIIISVFAWSFPMVASWLLQLLCLVIMVGCHVCFVSRSCVVISRGCIMVIAIIVSLIGCCGWLSFPMIASSFWLLWLQPMSWMLDVVLIVVVGCHG